jgi:hypothetical protein
MRTAANKSKRLLLICSIVFSFSCRAQIANYVSNGGFEAHTTCDLTKTITTYVKNAIGWDEIDHYTESSIWAHYCWGGVPYNDFFYQYPHVDSAYIAIDLLCLTCTQNTPRTNVRNHLKEPLKSGITYCVKFYVNIRETSNFAIDAFDAYFGGSEVDTITRAHQRLTFLNPQISNPINNFIKDTVGWSLISGTFTATGGEKYMVIGNFRSDAATNTVILTSFQNQGCEIAVDDVSCIPIDLPANAGRDTFCFTGTKVYLGRERDVGIDEACRWYKLPITITPTTPAIDTAAGIWVSPTATSTYVVRQHVCGVIKFDTVVVNFSGVGLYDIPGESSIELFPNPACDNIIIAGGNSNESLSLELLDIGGRILQTEYFSPGQKRSVDISLANGVYFVTLFNAGCCKTVKKVIVSR